MQPQFAPPKANSTYRRTKIRRLLPWLPVVLWMAFIFFSSAQSSLPGFSQSLLDLFLKKGAHFAVFALLALLAHRALRADLAAPAALLVAALIAIGYGALDELHQSFVAGRHASPFDVLIDSAGALAALTIIQRIQRRSVATPIAGAGQFPPQQR